MRDANGSTLELQNLNVFFGNSHALQGVDLVLRQGILSVVGRNGMGKTTLCNAIMGLVTVSSGSISFRGKPLVGVNPADIARSGIGYVPQGRRIWRSLTVEEHLDLVAQREGSWTKDRVYSTFPRLAERRQNLGGHLSGGEQQMLAIGRALLLNPKLLVMDEPTEGLAPMIVRQVEDTLIRLAESGGVDVLVIEQNIGVACAVSEQVAIMVNGRINRTLEAASLADDTNLQQALLGVGRHAHDDTGHAAQTGRTREAAAGSAYGPQRVYLSNPKIPDRWSQPVPVRVIEGSARTRTDLRPRNGETIKDHRPATRRLSETVLVAGTLDTKGDELRYLRDRLNGHGLRVQIADLSTSGKPSGAEIPPHVIAGFHPRGAPGVFTGDRGSAVSGMAVAFERWIRNHPGVAGIIGAGGSGATALVTPAMRSLPVGVPKLVVSTVASGDVSEYVGPTDILMLHSVADVQGINTITRDVLTNAAAALAGMVNSRSRNSTQETADKPAVGLTMFGVTTPCVQRITSALDGTYDCLVFHATGVGGRSMEKLLDSGKLAAVIDVTTTEVCDMIAGGVFAANEDRFGASIRTEIPYIGACGALDMVNFRDPDSVPEHYRDRNLYMHNPQVTLMRTSPEENDRIGRWIGERLNRMNGPVRFFLPEGGVSALDREGQPFWDSEADDALFRALEDSVRQTSGRRLVRSPHNINDDAFADEVLRAFRELHNVPGRLPAGAIESV